MNRLSRIGLLAVVIAAGCLTVAVGAAEAKEPTPPPPITLPPSTGDAVPPADAIVPSHQWAVCSGWYQSSTYGGHWTTDGSWWEYNCPLTGMVDESTALWTDYYYWDGSSSVYYGEWWTEPYDYWFGNPSCSWWRDPADNWYGPYACPQETNESPSASFTFTCSGLSCSFDANSSSDSDGTIGEFRWYFGDGSDGAYGATVEHVFAAGRTYDVSLVVTDDGGLTGYSSQAVSVSSSASPIATFSAACSGLSCRFDASSSSDADGTIQTYAWSFGDGTWTSGAASAATHAYGQAGTYSIRLVVTDDSGDSAAASRDVTVTNAVPTAAFTLSCSGRTCSFDGSGSVDPDGTIAIWSWSFGDGTTGSGATLQHAYAQVGTYTVTLTVTDDGDATSSNATTVSLISLTATGYKVTGRQKVDLAWTGSSPAGFDVYRNGARIATVQATAYMDNLNKKGAGRYVYKVCGVATSVCSGEATVTF